MRQVKTILVVSAMVLGLMSVTNATAAWSEDFESGYSIGPIDGQNGWANLYGAGLSVNNTCGEGGGWGACVVNKNAWAGSKKAHGEPTTNGDMLTLEFDIGATSPPAQSRIALRGAGAPYLLVGFNYGATGSYAFEALGADSWALDSGPMNVAGWHHVEMTWHIGSSAEVKVWDASDTLVYSPGAQTYTGLEDLPDLQYYSRYGSVNAIDNINVSTSVFSFPGDVNDDFFVGGVDITRIVANWGITGATREQGDLNGDGTVGGADYTEVYNNWGNIFVPPEPPEAPGAIPEPSTLLLLAGGVLAGLIRRR